MVRKSNILRKYYRSKGTIDIRSYVKYNQVIYNISTSFDDEA